MHTTDTDTSTAATIGSDPTIRYPTDSTTAPPTAVAPPAPTNRLQDAALEAVVVEILATADREDPGHIDRVMQSFDVHRGIPDAGGLADQLADAALPVCREVGRLLYQLARSRAARLVVEFGTSFGVSTIHLAAALKDNGGGRLVTTELQPDKAARAAAHLTAAGVADVVDIRIGDARRTLDDAGLTDIDLVLLDGWKDLYLDVLHLLQPRLAVGALVVADDLQIAPDQLAPYLVYVRDPRNGWLSVELPLDDGLELSLWTGGAPV